MNLNSQRRLAAIAARWNQVEPRMKEVELLRGETIYAAVNELRYTGRKIADVLLLVAEGGDDEETLAKIDEQLIIAENYLVNADHDLTDSAVLFVGIRIKRIIEAHGLEKVRRIAPEFDQLDRILDEAKRVVVESRGDRTRRKEVYAKLAEHHVPKLVDLYGKVTSHAGLSIPDKEIKKGLSLVAGLTMFGVVCALGTFLINFWFWKHYVPNPSIGQIRSVVEDVVKTAPMR